MSEHSLTIKSYWWVCGRWVAPGLYCHLLDWGYSLYFYSYFHLPFPVPISRFPFLVSHHHIKLIQNPIPIPNPSPSHLTIFLRINLGFLAKTGAQVVTLSVCPSVCLSGTSLSRTLNLHLSGSYLQADFKITSI